MAAASLNSLYNVLLKDKGKSITLYNHPLPRPPLQVVMAYLYIYAHVYTLFFLSLFFRLQKLVMCLALLLASSQCLAFVFCLPVSLLF